MYRPAFCYRVLAAAAAIVLSAASANAVPAYNTNQQLPAQQISQFMSNPNELLVLNPNGGGALIARLRDLLASDPATLNTIMGLLPNANDSQKAAMGAALAQASKLYASADPNVALLIQQAVVNSKDDLLTRAYLAAAGETQIAATGGAGGGEAGGGGVGGQTNVTNNNGGNNGGGPQQIGGNALTTGNFSFSGGSASGAGGSSSSVSPH
jgi:hypothetical protein